MKFLKIFEQQPKSGFNYRAWTEAAELEIAVKQEALQPDFIRWPRWDYDLAKGKLYFSDDVGVHLTADIQIIGTTGHHNWMWAWANSHLPEAYCEDSRQTKAFGEEHSIAELVEPYAHGKDLTVLGWSLTAVAVRVCGAMGAYRAPTERGAIYLAIKDIGQGVSVN